MTGRSLKIYEDRLNYNNTNLYLDGWGYNRYIKLQNSNIIDGNGKRITFYDTNNSIEGLFDAEDTASIPITVKDLTVAGGNLATNAARIIRQGYKKVYIKNCTNDGHIDATASSGFCGRGHKHFNSVLTIIGSVNEGYISGNQSGGFFCKKQSTTDNQPYSAMIYLHTS